MKDNIHYGHRERMIERAFNNIDSLAEHELLEVLLYSVMPRVDTNPLAHRLIRAFGDLEGVFRATTAELITVEGVGKRIATEICLLGRIFSIVKPTKKKRTPAFSFSQLKDEIVLEFSKLQTEKVVIYLLDKKYNILQELPWEDKKRDNASAQVAELIKSFAIFKPTYLIVAHNHPSSSATPSDEDDFTTKKLNMICDIHGVSLIDHIIVAGGQAFSYCIAGRLADIKKASDINKMIKTLE